MANEDFPEGGVIKSDFCAVVYTRLGPMKVTLKARECLAGACTLHANQEVEKECLFFSTTSTGAGDEVGWDFVSRVKTSKISFTGFC